MEKSEEKCQKHKCQFCKKKFVKHGNYLLHLESEHDDETTYNCALCKFVLTNVPAYRSHYKSCLRKHQKTQKPQDLKCQFCSKNYAAFGLYFGHMKFYHEHEKSFKCVLCGEIFYSMKKYRVHYNSTHHKNAQKFKCDKCPKTFRRYPNYKSHYNIMHLNIKKLKCNACGKTFGYRKSFVYHIKKVHGLESINAYELDKIEKCGICGEVFNNEDLLNQHAKEIHKKTKNFKCQHCEKSFRNLKKLSKHLEKIQKKKDENENIKEPKIIVAVESKNQVQNDAVTTDEFTKEELKPSVNFDDPNWWKTF